MCLEAVLTEKLILVVKYQLRLSKTMEITPAFLWSTIVLTSSAISKTCVFVDGTSMQARANCLFCEQTDSFKSLVKRSWNFCVISYVTKSFFDNFRRFIVNFSCLNFVCCCNIFQVSPANFVDGIQNLAEN